MKPPDALKASMKACKACTKTMRNAHVHNISFQRPRWLTGLQGQGAKGRHFQDHGNACWSFARELILYSLYAGQAENLVSSQAPQGFKKIVQTEDVVPLSCGE